MIVCRILCGFLASLEPALGACSLEILWTSNVGGPRNAPMGTPLPRGRVFLAGLEGRYWVVNPEGQVEMSGSDPELGDADALTSDESGSVYILAGHRTVLVMRPAPPARLRVRKFLDLPLFATDIAVTRDGHLYASGVLAGSRLPLHSITPRGTVERSFGEDAGPSYLSNHRGMRGGNLLWDHARERLLFLPWPLREVEAYDPEGNLTAVGGRGWMEPAAQAATLPRGSALLPEGQLVVQESPFSAAWELVVYDLNLRRTCKVRDPMVGRLFGASPEEGDLFFLANGRLSRLRLQGVTPGGMRTVPVRCVTPEKREPARQWPPKPTRSAFSRHSEFRTALASTR